MNTEITHDHQVAAMSDAVTHLRGAEAIFIAYADADREMTLTAYGWAASLTCGAVNRLHGAQLVTADYLSDLIWQCGWAENFADGELQARGAEFASILKREAEGWAELKDGAENAPSAPLPLGRYDFMGMRD